MPAKKLSLNPDDVLEWLLDRGFVEPTSSANSPYRIAVNENDFLPYSITFLTKKLSERFCKRNMKIRSKNLKSWRRELLKCFDEHCIKYDNKGTRGSMYWQFRETTKIYLEKKLHIDLDQIHEYDRQYRSNHPGGMRYTSYWHQQLKRHGEESALEKFKKYFDRRMQELSVDLRTKRLPNSEYKEHNEPLEDVKQSNH